MLAAVGRFYFDAQTDEERRNSIGTIFIFLVIFPPFILILLEIFGPRLFELVTPDVPYRPYLQMAAWATYFSIFSVVPLMVLRSRQEARKFLFLNLGQTFLFHALTIGLVIYGHWEVVGMFWANLISAFVFALIYIYLTIRLYPPRFSILQLKKILGYSLPLIPHGLAGWVLLLSDRLILQHWAPLADVGVYSLGYTIGMLVQNAGEAATNAWFPSFYASQSSGQNKQNTIDVVTYFVLGISAIALVLVIGAHHFVGWFLPQSYAGAEKVVIWVAISGIFLQIYYILSYSIHYQKKTTYLPVISWTAGISNVVLNLWLVPVYGYLAAAVNTLIAYIIMALLTLMIGHKLYPVAYEYKRWAIAIISTIGICLLSSARPALHPLPDLLFSIALLPGWLILLLVLGFYSSRDKIFFSEILKSKLFFFTRNGKK